MNSNNLELSLIENEIEQLQSRYQLQHASHPQLQTQKLSDYQEGIQAAKKSPSVITFGTNAEAANVRPGFNSQGGNPLQELTLNKEGQVAIDVKHQKINPKDLSNDELEYIIKTGKLPPRLVQQEQRVQFSGQATIMTPEATLPINGSTLKATSNVFHNNHLMGQQQTTHDKENYKAANGVRGKVINYDDPHVLEQMDKNLNSPMQIKDQHKIFAYNQSGFDMQLNPLLSSSVQPINPVFNPNGSSFLVNIADTSRTFDQHQQQPAAPSHAASQAMKALQDKIKQLEGEKQLLEDKLAITDAQTREQINKLQQKLREECEKSGAREQHFKEELQIMKRQMENLEQEKTRHLEENSNEREQWRQQYKKVEAENLKLKLELKEQVDKYSQMEETINDIKRREQQLRQKFQSEVEAERQRVKSQESEIEEVKQRYEQLKQKLKNQNKHLKNENDRVKDQAQQEVDRADKERNKQQKEAEKWKRECHMLKEELNIMNSSKEQRSHKLVSKSGMTPSSARDKQCKSPSSQNEDPIIQLHAVVNHSIDKFGSIDSNLKKSQKKKRATKKQNMEGTTSSQKILNPHKREGSSCAVKAIGSERKRSQSKTAYKKSKNPPGRSKSSKKEPTRMRSVQSQDNLISINTRDGKAEALCDDSNPYIFIQHQQSTTKHGNNKINNDIPNQFKRPSVESIQFGLSSTFSDNNSISVFSQGNQNSIDKRDRAPLDIQEISGSIMTKMSDRVSVDNEIFYLEREIFDYNQQYKSLLSQQSSEVDQASFNAQLRKIAQHLEEKSERLFELKKQQQEILLKEAYGSARSKKYNF